MGPDGQPCGRQTLGLLGWRRVLSVPGLLAHVGKESNRLEEAVAGLEHDPDEVWTAYADPALDPWRSFVLPVLRSIPSRLLAAATGRSERSIREIRNGHSLPRSRHRDALIRAAAETARTRLREKGDAEPADNLAACAAFACVLASDR